MFYINSPSRRVRAFPTLVSRNLKPELRFDQTWLWTSPIEILGPVKVLLTATKSLKPVPLRTKAYLEYSHVVYQMLQRCCCRCRLPIFIFPSSYLSVLHAILQLEIVQLGCSVNCRHRVHRQFCILGEHDVRASRNSEILEEWCQSVGTYFETGWVRCSFFPLALSCHNVVVWRNMDSMGYVSQSHSIQLVTNISKSPSQFLPTSPAECVDVLTAHVAALRRVRTDLMPVAKSEHGP